MNESKPKELDHREHTPEWYAPLLSKGWIKLPHSDMIIRVGINGDVVRIRCEEVIPETDGSFTLIAAGFQHRGSLESCLSEAKPLFWNGVAA